MMNKTVYVTKFKIHNLLKSVDLNRSDININNLYQPDLSKILSKPELSLLALYSEVLGNPEVLVIDKYIKKEHKDSKKYIYQSIYPAFHKSDRCERLRADFNNFEIPVKIQAQGDKAIAEFRTFFKENINLYEDNNEAFMAHIGLKFGIAIPPKKIEYKNSGIETVLNASGLDIENSINKLLLEMDKFRNSSELNQKEIRDYGYATHKAFSFDNNGQMIKKMEIKGSIISQWHHYKNKLKYLLREYFRIKLNPDFLFDVNILEQLGFQACSCCK